MFFSFKRKKDIFKNLPSLKLKKNMAIKKTELGIYLHDKSSKTTHN